MSSTSCQGHKGPVAKNDKKIHSLPKKKKAWILMLIYWPFPGTVLEHDYWSPFYATLGIYQAEMEASSPPTWTWWWHLAVEHTAQPQSASGARRLREQRGNHYLSAKKNQLVWIDFHSLGGRNSWPAAWWLLSQSILFATNAEDVKSV